jgi:hypothetical protein
MLDSLKIISSLKTQNENKVAVSLKLPESVKSKLLLICDNESISMNSLIVAAVEALILDYENKK